MESFAGYVRPEWSLPITERLADTVLALPLGVHVTPDVARQVAGEIRAAVASHAVAPR
jgi:dTDP-4-amino-4,6-dideoxygalactose transaminase